MVEIFQEPRLIDRHQRPQAHRDGRELPELGHQPGMRVRRQAVAVDLLSEVEELLLGKPPFQERAGVDARGAMSLNVDQVPAVMGGRGPPEMAEADIVESGRGLEAGDVAAELGGLLVGAEHNGQRVPADQGADALLDGAIPRMPRLPIRRDRVEVGGIGRVWDGCPLAARLDDELIQKEMRPLGALELEHRRERVEPLPSF